jgi:hypothetical protein
MFAGRTCVSQVGSGFDDGTLAPSDGGAGSG